MLTFINTLTFERRCTCPPERIVARRRVRTGCVAGGIGLMALRRRIPDTPPVGRLAGECLALVLPSWCHVDLRSGMRRIDALGVDRIYEREH